jgi:hypothetical protein
MTAKNDYNYLCGLDYSAHDVHKDKAPSIAPPPTDSSPLLFGNVRLKNLMVGLLYFCNQQPGMFVAPFLLLEGTSESRIGVVLFISGIIALTLQTPAGQLVDEIHNKTRVLIVGNLVTILGCVLLSNISNVGIVTIAVTFNLVSDVFCLPTLYATTLGIFGSDGIEKQTPLNEIGLHAGNAFFAVLAAVIVVFGAANASSIFYVCVAMRCAGIFIIVQYINSYDIDFNKSRGLVDVTAATLETSTHSIDDLASITLIPADEPLSYKALLSDFHVIVFLLSVMLFHFVNASMLPLLTQQLFISNSEKGRTSKLPC